MEVRTEVPVDFSGKSGGIVIVRRYCENDKNLKFLESGRVAISLDIFRKCFTKIKEG